MIRVGHFGPKVPADVRQQVERLSKDMARSKLNAFAGPIYDRDGQMRVPKGSVASDADVLNMNYLVQGVQGALP
jgi:simple sugar transport system substrate-binding protein